MLEAAGRSLRVVANVGVGDDNFDLEAVRRRGVRATNTPGVLTAATAELAVALKVGGGRRVAEGDALVRRGGAGAIRSRFWAAAWSARSSGSSASGGSASGSRGCWRGLLARVLYADGEISPPGGGLSVVSCSSCSRSRTS